MFTKWFEFWVSVHVLQYEFWVSKLLFTHKRTTFLFLYYPKINTSAECTSIILCIHVTMKVCLNIHLHTPARSKYPARQIKFLRQVVFYGVSLLTVNVWLWFTVGLGLVIVLQLFSCCLLRHFLITVELKQMAPSDVHSRCVGTPKWVPSVRTSKRVLVTVSYSFTITVRVKFQHSELVLEFRHLERELQWQHSV